MGPCDGLRSPNHREPPVGSGRTGRWRVSPLGPGQKRPGHRGETDLQTSPPLHCVPSPVGVARSDRSAGRQLEATAGRSTGNGSTTGQASASSTDAIAGLNASKVEDGRHFELLAPDQPEPRPPRRFVPDQRLRDGDHLIPVGSISRSASQYASSTMRLISSSMIQAVSARGSSPAGTISRVSAVLEAELRAY